MRVFAIAWPTHRTSERARLSPGCQTLDRCGQKAISTNVMQSILKIRSANAPTRFGAPFHQQRVSHRRVLRERYGYPADEHS